MANPYSGFAKGFGQGRQMREQRSQNAVDELVKMAQLKELGYDVQPGRGGLFGGGPTLSQRPDYVSEKELSRNKTSLELDKLRREERDAAEARNLLFGGWSMFGQQDSSEPAQPSQTIGSPAQPQMFGGKQTAVSPSGRRPVAKTIKFGGQTFENPAYAEYESQLKVEEAAKKKEGEWNVKRSDVGRRLENLYKVSDQVPRGSGTRFGVIPNRILTGLKTEYEQFGQTTPRGIAAGQLEDSAKDILAPLARLAGDVGNLAEWEQKIRLNLIPSKWDSAERVELKKAYLNELSRIVSSDQASPNQIDSFFDKIGASATQSFDSVEEAEASGIKGEVMIGGRRAVIE